MRIVSILSVLACSVKIGEGGSTITLTGGNLHWKRTARFYGGDEPRIGRYFVMLDIIYEYGFIVINLTLSNMIYLYN